MISYTGSQTDNRPFEIYGLSTDDKPTQTLDGYPISNQSTFYEMDTKKVFMFDEENARWLEQ